MWFCIFSHSLDELTRLELRAQRPDARIDHDEWNTRLVADYGESVTSAQGATKMLEYLDTLFEQKRVSQGVYQVPYAMVHWAFDELMQIARTSGEPAKTQTLKFYGLWTLILALCVWQFAVKMIAAYVWVVLMLFLGGGKASNVVVVAILFRIANNRSTIEKLLTEVRAIYPGKRFT